MFKSFSFQGNREAALDAFYLAALSLFFLIFGLGNGSLASWDEAIYAQIAKEMAQSGEWFHLTWMGSSWVEKPLLTFWAMAGFYKILGVSEFSARLFSALCGAGTVLTVYFFARRLFSRWTGFLSAAVLMSSAHFIKISKFATMDAPLSFFLTLSLYFFWRGRTQTFFLILSGVAAGLVFMTKSFAVVFVFMILWSYCFLAKEHKALRQPAYGWGLLAAALIALPWLYCGFAHLQPQFGQEMVKNLFGRSLSSVDEHTGNYYFYIRTMINKFRPWILIGLFSAPFFLYKAVREKNKEMLFVSVWFFSVLAVVTLMRTKLQWYVAPLYPALSISVGWVLARFLKEKFAGWAKLGFLALMIMHVPASHIFDSDYSREIKGIAPQLAQAAPGNETVYLYGFNESPAALFYWKRINHTLFGTDRLKEEAAKNGSIFCLIRAQDLEPVRASFSAEQFLVQGKFENLHLVQIKSSGESR